MVSVFRYLYEWPGAASTAPGDNKDLSVGGVTSCELRVTSFGVGRLDEEGGGDDGDGEVEALVDGFVDAVAVDQVVAEGVDGDEEGPLIPTDVGGAGAESLDGGDDGDVLEAAVPVAVFSLGLVQGLAAPVGTEEGENALDGMKAKEVSQHEIVFLPG